MENTGNQFGTLKGVFIPSILTILGVILFLRLGWVVGQAGIVLTVFIISLSSLITFLTGLSISATATNTKVGSGGSYFLISRCFGLEPGAAVGVPLYLAQALGISFYSVGFAESLALFFPDVPVNTVALLTLVTLTAVTLFSSELALRTQTLIFALIVMALISFWLGSPMVEVKVPEGLAPEKFSFWEIFAVFFPAVTGIEAGISMSGDLKDPRKSLPLGTMAAVIVGLVVYIASAIMLNKLATPSELITNSLIMTDIAYVSILIFIGLWGATLSSTMGALLGAPRTLQALAQDKIMPGFLAKGAAKTNDPQVATLVSALVAAAGIFIGDLNTIASVLSMFFLTSYGALNLVAGLEGLIDNPSWRPTFKVAWALSLAGAVLCFGAMFMIDPGSSFMALIAVGFVYYVTKKRKLKSNYTDIRSGLTLYFVREFLYKLNKSKKDARNWRPNFLVLSGSPNSRLHLIQIADSIGHNRGFITVASVLTSGNIEPEKLQSFENANQDFLAKNKIQALTKTVRSENFKQAVLNLVDYYGLGLISPNTLIFGDTSKYENLDSHAQILSEVHKKGKNILVIKDSKETMKKADEGGKLIDVWWGGKGANRSLMLAFAYMLSTSSRWKGSKIRINCLVGNEEGKKGIANNLKEFLSSSRLKAECKIMIAEKKDYRATMVETSKDADVVFFGLQSPSESEDFKKYYIDMMNSAAQFKTTIFTLAAEKVSFDEIFD